MWNCISYEILLRSTIYNMIVVSRERLINRMNYGNNLELQELDDRLTQTLISPSPETDNWIELEYW